MKKVLIALVSLAVGFGLKSVIEDFLYDRTKSKIEEALFPQINLLEPVSGQTCKPQFVYHSKTQLLVYCDNLNSEDKVLREVLRLSVKTVLANWAVENNYGDRFMYVSFQDEIVQAPRK